MGGAPLESGCDEAVLPPLQPRSAGLSPRIDANDLLDVVQELSGVGGWELGPDDERPWWTPEVYRLHELPLGAPPPLLREAIAFYHPAERPRLTALIGRAFQTGAGFSSDFRFRTALGRERWVRAVCRAIRSENRTLSLVGTFQDITERKESEQRLADAEARWRYALEGAGDGVWDWDLGQGTVFFSRQWKAMLGYAEPEIGTSMDEWASRVHPEDLERARAAVQAHLEGRSAAYVCEHRVRHRDGSWRWILDRGRVISHGADGKPRRMIGTHTDVTERRLTEEQLRISQERLYEAQAIARIGSWHVDLISRTMDWSPEARRICGLPSPGGNQCQDFADIIHPADRVRVEAAWVCALAGAPYDLRHRLVVHGEEKWIHDRALVEFGSDGQPRSAHGTLQDITAQVRIEEELERSQRHLSLIVAAVPGVVYQFVLTPDGAMRMDYISPRVRDICGVEAEAVRHDVQILFHQIHPEDRERVEASVPVSARQNTPWQQTYRIVRPDGQLRWIEAHSLPHREEDGTVRWSGLLQDVTDRIEASERQRRLEHQLLHARKLETIGTLAGGVAHDFNNLLAGINAHTELALLALDPEHPAHSHLTQAFRGGQRARDLVRRLLLYARRTPQAERRPILIRELVEELGPLLQVTLPPGVELRTQAHGPPRTVLADASQLHQVLMNLCLNAGQAIGPTGGTVSIEVRATLESSDVLLSVSDDGRGMDEATLQRIFDPFFTTKEPGEGTGLGLSVAFGIIREHGGTIEATSRLGSGSRFEIRLPAVPLAPTSPVASPPLPTADTLGRGRRVLLVDDNPAVVESTRRQLVKLGFVVDAAHSGPEGLACVQQGEGGYALLVTDESMPGLRGQDLIRQAREVRPGLPAVLMSGNLDPAALGEPESLTGMVILDKPFTLAELGQAVTAALPA